MNINVNFRKTKEGEIIAVFPKECKNGKYLCFSFCDNMHFDATMDYLKECTPVKRWYWTTLKKQLERVGYSNMRVLYRINY